MDKGWHTYWRNPGDSGGPIEIDWDLPKGFSVSDIKWPLPEKIEYPPLMTYGYEAVSYTHLTLPTICSV